VKLDWARQASLSGRLHPKTTGGWMGLRALQNLVVNRLSMSWWKLNLAPTSFYLPAHNVSRVCRMERAWVVKNLKAGKQKPIWPQRTTITHSVPVAKSLADVRFSRRQIFRPDNGGHKHPRNGNKPRPHYTAQQSTKQSSSKFLSLKCMKSFNFLHKLSLHHRVSYFTLTRMREHSLF
jgi:hypothetical protein